jgi:hypothetical protein
MELVGLILLVCSICIVVSISRWIFRINAIIERLDKLIELAGGKGKTLALLAVAVALLATSAMAAGKSKKAADPYPSDALDVKIYQEFERCANASKEQVKSDKLGGQAAFAQCAAKLQTYGKDRAAKAFGFYFDM